MRFDLGEARGILERTPGVVRALVGEVPELWAKAHYGPGTWTPREIVGHLIFGEMTDWVPRMRIILKHGTSRPFAPFDRTGHRTVVANRTIASLVDEFAVRRAERLGEVDAMRIDPAHLDLEGMHPEFGPVTLRQLIAAWVAHDLNHIAQLSKAMAFQYKDQVGPWEAYLSILAPPNPR
jgi:hypothetical protein